MTANGKKFATASLEVGETKIIKPDPLTLERVKELRVIADSLLSDLWWHNGNGQLLNKFNYIVATYEQKTDAAAMANFSPETIMQLTVLAEQALSQAD
jgi:hypothetical protein